MRRIACALLAAGLLTAGCAARRDARSAAPEDSCAVAAVVGEPAEHVAADGSVQTRFRFADIP